MTKKLSNKIKYLLSTVFILFVYTIQINAEVTFNQTQAAADIKSLLDPVSNVLIGAGFGITLISVGLSYFNYMGKDDDEKQSIPFHKTVKKHVFAFILLGFVGVILKWFSIS